MEDKNDDVRGSQRAADDRIREHAKKTHSFEGYTANVPPVDLLARVISNVRLSDDYNVLTLEAPDVGARTQPGQFVMVKPEGLEVSLLRRPFSVFEIIRTDSQPTAISIFNKRAGSNTRRLYALEAGQRVQCLGPLGKPFTSEDVEEAWMVAGGVGLAPFATLAEALARSGTRSTLFYGARSARELFYLEFFAHLGTRLVLATEDGSRGTKARVTGPLEQALAALPGPNRVTVYACGPEAMLAAVAKLTAKYRQPSQVSVERVMGCGLGGCYSCVIPVKHGTEAHLVRSCIGGPVFAGADIVWDM
jgi:dihydroorotate dehydrogenase electron transfer subunit